MGSFSATFSRKNITFYTKISPGDMIANIPLGLASYGKRQDKLPTVKLGK